MFRVCTNSYFLVYHGVDYITHVTSKQVMRVTVVQSSIVASLLLSVACFADRWYCEPEAICKPAEYLCDGHKDCANGIDEIECGGKCKSSWW